MLGNQFIAERVRKSLVFLVALHIVQSDGTSTLANDHLFKRLVTYHPGAIENWVSQWSISWWTNLTKLNKTSLFCSIKSNIKSNIKQINLLQKKKGRPLHIGAASLARVASLCCLCRPSARPQRVVTTHRCAGPTVYGELGHINHQFYRG